VCGPPWERWVMHMTTPWLKASLQAWNVNWLPGEPGRPRAKPTWRSLPGLRVSTTHDTGIQD